ncbi:unnamed protein product [Nesidiocoris tenuis]|uniref:Uncharacterized protein n=1 Tax=Nesidiocoris tenuis TaxID=355587 RepID=A0A6H5GBS9_9HEMI|nr:unnamed protein product [Nesidiocoris tenuis]
MSHTKIESDPRPDKTRFELAPAVCTSQTYRHIRSDTLMMWQTWREIRSRSLNERSRGLSSGPRSSLSVSSTSVAGELRVTYSASVPESEIGNAERGRTSESSSQSGIEDEAKSSGAYAKSHGEASDGRAFYPVHPHGQQGQQGQIDGLTGQRIKSPSCTWHRSIPNNNDRRE